MASKEEAIKQLIELMQKRNNNGGNDEAFDAIEALREEGWLIDGSLNKDKIEKIFPKGIILDKADLRGTNLSKAILNGVLLSAADLRWANLQGADLSNANLSEANLSGIVAMEANFSGANLRHANLRHANISGANLSHADLSDSNLTEVQAIRANFSNSNLAGVNFSKANIKEAKFLQSNFGDTILVDIDLSSAIGLETIRHYLSSKISVDTLFQSRGKIPEIFLRGCGVPESLITYLPSLMENAIDLYSCFISYNRANSSFAQRVHDTLQGRGIRCWLDTKQILPGDKWAEEIYHGIRVWDKIILCCSKESLSVASWVNKEIDMAFQKEEELVKKYDKDVPIVIPLDLDGYIFTPEFTGSHASRLKTRHIENFQGWEHDNSIFEGGIERVIRALRTDGGKAPPPTSKL